VLTTPAENKRHGVDLHAMHRLVAPAFARLPVGARRSILHAFGKYAPWEDGFDPTPPPVRGNEVTGPPDFVGIGVQKAGTTWWFNSICAHPDVYARGDIHKERHFFGRYANRRFGPAECKIYHDWFPRPPDALTGEWTPDYIHCPWVPALLAQAAPRTRLLVLLRDPVERFRSGLAHQRRDRGRLTVETYQDAVTRGLYHEALGRWTEYFPPEQVLLLQYEQCIADPGFQLARTHRFLGLEPIAHEENRERVNATARTIDLEEDVRRRLVQLYESDVRALSQRFPDFDLRLWPNFTNVSTE
jgi:hypothetical protein